MYIAAYGTLQNRFGRWQQLGMEGNCKVVGRVKLQGKLYQQRWFPMLVKSDDPNDLVDAELIEIVSDRASIISKLDYFEGHPDFFKREKFEVDGKEVISYVWTHPVDGYKRIKEFVG